MAFTVRRKSPGPAALELVNESNPGGLPFKVVRHEFSLDKQLITPQMAKYLLEHHNGRNRPVKETRVDAYSMELKLGKWKYNGERILFDSNGNLLSGQHRLLAIVKSGISMLVDLKFGLDPDVRDTIDTGAVRSPTDVRRLVTGNKDQAFINKSLNAVKKILNRRRTSTSAVLFEMLENDFRRGLAVATALIKGRFLLGRGPAAGAVVLAAEAFPVKVRTFLEEIKTLSPTSTAGKELLRYITNGFNGDKEDDIADKVLFAIYAHLTNREGWQKLQTGHHDEIVEFFLDAIKRNHDLETLSVICPG